MSHEFNPYGPPLAEIVPPAARPAAAKTPEYKVWRDGNVVVALRDAPFPPRCIRCNAAVPGGLVERRFSWRSSWWLLLILIATPLYVIVSALVAKRATHAVALCDRHAERRSRMIYLGLGLIVLGLPLLLLGHSAAAWVLLGIASFFAGVLVLFFNVRILKAILIDERYSRFRGASGEFLASLPVFSSYRR